MEFKLGLSIGHLLVIILVVVVLFGANRIPSLMKDMAKGIKAFKDEMKDDEKKG